MEKLKNRPLSTVEAGQTVKMVRAEAGRGLNNRLASMGLVPNTEITVVSSGRPGAYVISVKGSRMMLGRGMANKIIVS
jgi:Fe2+ transport system protein FeoA